MSEVKQTEVTLFPNISSVDGSDAVEHWSYQSTTGQASNTTFAQAYSATLSTESSSL